MHKPEFIDTEKKELHDIREKEWSIHTNISTALKSVCSYYFFLLQNLQSEKWKWNKKKVLCKR
jgi:hypothetical protein